MADVAPQANPSGYDATVTLAIANDTKNQLIASRFNWKWNSRNARPFLTNSWQQDYPGIGLSDIGWLEQGWWVDTNSNALPKPSDRIQAARDLSPAGSGYSGTAPGRVCWMYNRQLQYGTWPGAGVNYYPLIAPMVQQNPPMAIQDENGVILTLTSKGGTTGADAPKAPAEAKEGDTILDGTCTWTVCSPDSQGFRLDYLPPAAGPVLQVIVKYQMSAALITSLQATLDPIPDDYGHHFRVGFRTNCYAYAKDAKTRAEHPQMLGEWLNSIGAADKQGDKEPDSFRLLPATPILRPVFGLTRNPRDPGRPY
jgi:hypothetical protein